MVPSILLCPFIQSIFKRAQVSFWPWWSTIGAGMGKLLLSTGERRNIPFLFILEVAVDLGHWGPSYYGAPLNICLLFVSSIQFRRHFGERKMSRNERSDLIDLGLFICFPSPCVKIEDTLLLRNSSSLPSLNDCVLFQLLINYSEWKHEFKYFWFTTY